MLLNIIIYSSVGVHNSILLCVCFGSTFGIFRSKECSNLKNQNNDGSTIPPISTMDDRLLQRVAENGLVRTTEPQQIIIVGAGIAGLVAGYTLKTAGHHVTLLEGNSRIGGRILTYTDSKYGWKAELGAMKIPETHTLVNIFLRKFNLSLFDFIQHNENTFYWVNDQLIKTYAAETDPNSLQYNTVGNERGKTADQLFTEAVCPVVQELKDRGWNFIVKKYGNLSVRQYLVQAGLSRGAIEMIGIVLNEESTFETSFLESFRDTVEGNDKTKFKGILGGSENLPKSFQPYLGGDIILNASVTKVDQNGQKVKVLFNNLNGSISSVYGDYVIMTTSAPVTSFIEFTPPLSLAKQEALRSLHYDASTKVFLYFSERFWEADNIKGGYSITDKRSRFIYYPSYVDKSLGSGGVVLASYTWGNDARAWSSNHKECIDYALWVLSKMHRRDLKKILVNGVVKRWQDDDFTRGAFALFTPSQEETLYPALMQPEHRCFFAGEHTTRRHAWIEDSIESGLRAAIQISVNSFDVIVI